MKIKQHNFFKKGGIYKITNQINGMFYIGSTNSFKRRSKEHFSVLRRNEHKNKHLQNTYNKYGKDMFVFEVVEVVEGNKGERFVVEQKYIDKLISEGKWEQTYNFKKFAEQDERSCFSRTPEETKKFLSEKSIEMWADPNHRSKFDKYYNDPKWIENQSQKQKEASKNPEYGNSAEANRKRLSDPKEKEKLSNKLKEAWAKDDGSRKEKASELAKIIYAENKEKITEARVKAKAKHYGKVISPEGEIFEIYNAQAFIREHGFSQMFYELLNGKYQSYKGWKRFNE